MKTFIYLLAVLLGTIVTKNQNTDLFKFIIYSATIGEQLPQMDAPK